MADTKSIALGALINGAVVTAVAAGAFGIWGDALKSNRELQSQLILTLLQHDAAENRNVVSAFRTIEELGILDRIDNEKWQRHIEANHGSLPRFYYSGFIWSVFYPYVDDIKRAYSELGFYKGAIDGKADGGFVLATVNFQHSYCKKYDLRDNCDGFADGIVGKNTLRQIALELEEVGGKLVLE